jgi:hypothetical protein
MPSVGHKGAACRSAFPIPFGQFASIWPRGHPRTRFHLGRRRKLRRVRKIRSRKSSKYSAAAPAWATAARAFVAFRLIPTHGCYDLLYLLTLRHCLFEGLKALFKQDEGVWLAPVGSSFSPTRSRRRAKKLCQFLLEFAFSTTRSLN